MKIFDTGFKLNKRIALKNRDKDFKLPLRINTKSRNTNNYTKSIENISEQTFNEKVYLYKENAGEENLLDADYISESFERDSRRYSGNHDIDSEGGY